MILGCHVQMKAPLFLEGSVKEALGYGCNALMLYTGAPQNTKRRPTEEMHIKEAQALMISSRRVWIRFSDSLRGFLGDASGMAGRSLLSDQTWAWGGAAQNSISS